MNKFLFQAAAAAALLGLVTGLAGVWAFKSRRSPFPPPALIREVGGGAAGDALALALGMRRLAADVWFIRLMQYYGTPEFDYGSGGGHEHESRYGEGRYPEFTAYARHIMALDPWFLNAGLYAGASLAFNLSRPEEAVSLLNWARIYAPKEWKYAAMLAAVGYSKAKNPAMVAQRLSPLLSEPDCPAMIRQLAAFLNKKAGNYAAAYAIYSDMPRYTRDPFYIENAKTEAAKLRKLLNVHPQHP